MKYENNRYLYEDKDGLLSAEDTPDMIDDILVSRDVYAIISEGGTRYDMKTGKFQPRFMKKNTFLNVWYTLITRQNKEIRERRDVKTFAELYEEKCAEDNWRYINAYLFGYEDPLGTGYKRKEK